MKKALSLFLSVLLVVSLGAVAFGSSSMTARRSEAEKVFTMVNAEREKAGKAPLAWVEELYQPALTRAQELYTEFSHTRPDGSKWNTVSELAQGENIAWNRKDAADVMNLWVNSKGHYENMMGTNYNYTGMAVACVDTPNGPFWVQLFTLQDAKAIKNSETADKTTTTTQNTTSDTVSPSVQTPGGPAVTAPSADNFYSAKTLTTALTDQAAKQKGIVTPTIAAGKVLVADDIATLTGWESTSGRQAAISFDTYIAKSNRVQGRFSFYPSRFTQQKTNLSFGVYTQGKEVTAVHDRFSKWFSNDMAVIWLDFGGSLTGTAQIAARADLSKLNTENLLFYGYNPEKNTYSQLQNVEYRIDKNGYLHFATMEKCIILVDKPLAK